MDEKILVKLRGKIEDLRRQAANTSRDELEKLALNLGRKRRKASSKHPMYISPLPGTFSLSIPYNPGKGTVLSILKQLEGDLDIWEGNQEQERFRGI